MSGLVFYQMRPNSGRLLKTEAKFCPDQANSVRTESFEVRVTQVLSGQNCLRGFYPGRSFTQVLPRQNCCPDESFEVQRPSSTRTKLFARILSGPVFYPSSTGQNCQGEFCPEESFELMELSSIRTELFPV